MAREDAKGPLQNQTIDVSGLRATDPESPEFRKQAEAEILKRLGVGNSLNAANEWADAACNSVVWLKNIRDGISTPEEALKEMEANIARIRAASNLHCTVPPEGYECSRTPGHAGPCAAHPVAAEDQSPTQDQDYPVLDKARFESDILRIVKAPHYFYRTQNNEYGHLETQKLWTLWCHLTRILKIRNDAYKVLLEPVKSAKEEMRKRGIEFHQFKTMFPKLLSAFDAARQEMEKIPALEADLRYAKSVCAYEKRRREALEADLANVNKRLTSANIGLTMAQATAASLPQAISNSDTKRDPELRDALNDNGKAQVEFGLWYSKRYGNPDLTDTWKHAQYQDAREVWMACANLLSDGYQKRARNWRESFEAMHRRAMAAEQVVKDQSIMLSGERGQVEIWKQRAKEWCDKYTAISVMPDADEAKLLASFVAWWCRDVPSNMRPEWDKMVEDTIKNDKMVENLAGAWEGFQQGIRVAKSKDEKKTLTREEATALVKEYGRAVLQRNGFQVALTMNNLLDYLVGNLNIVGLARECIEDVISHHNDFVRACEFAKLGESGEDGVSYWTHQVKVLNRMKEQAESVLGRKEETELDNVGDESHHSHLNGGSL